MAEILDDFEKDEELQDNEEYSSFTDPVEQETQQEEQYTAEETEEVDDDIPEKYKGKSAKDIIRMHQEAEKLLGRQSSEVGELRKLVDNFILNQSSSQAAKPKEEDEEIDFFEDPKRAIEAAISKHPKIKAAEEMSASMKQQTILTQIERSHPDFMDILQDGNFAEWVKGSPVRMELYNRADKAYDFDAANELLSTWKERQRIVTQTKEVEEKELKRQRKAAATGSANGGASGQSRKIYRRSDIMNLMRTDPDRYMELADEITLAYAEKRVK